jgi:opacity protein-like surface antigen
MSRRALAALAAAAALLSPACFAAPGWYAGLSAGQSRTSDEVVRNRESTITNAFDLHTTFDEKDTAWKGFVGYGINDMLAVELDYADLGSMRMSTTMMAGDPGALQPAGIAIDRATTGFGAGLVVGAPLTPQISIFGRVGAFRSKLKASAALAGNIVFSNGNPSETTRSTTHTETVTKVGAGLDWALWRNGGLRLEWARYLEVGKPFAIGGTGTTGEADIDVVTLGAVFRF